MRFSLSLLVWVIAYVAMVAAVAGLLVRARGQVISAYGTPQAKTEWDAWREGAKQLAEESGPVKRRVPKSTQPPALVLMRDYFAVCMALALVLSTVLFGTTMFFVRGVLASPASFTDRSPPEPRRRP